MKVAKILKFASFRYSKTSATTERVAIFLFFHVIFVP